MAKKSLDDLLGLMSNNPEMGAKLLKNPSQICEEYALTEEQLAAVAGAGQITLQPEGGKYGDPTMPSNPSVGG